MDSRKLKALDYWFSTAKKDKSVADSLFKLGHYSWSLFIWHLVIEKTLKGIITELGKEPPLTHNLVTLSKEYTNLSINEDLEKKFLEINTFNIEARYENYKYEFYKKADKEYTTIWVKNCKIIYLWLLKQKKQS